MFNLKLNLKLTFGQLQRKWTVMGKMPTKCWCKVLSQSFIVTQTCQIKLFHFQIIHAIFSSFSHHRFHFCNCSIGSCLFCLSFSCLQIIYAFGLLVTMCSSSHHCCHIYLYLFFLSSDRLHIWFIGCYTFIFTLLSSICTSILYNNNKLLLM